jgi:hypothetical protein
MEGAGVAGHPLSDDLGVLVDKDGHAPVLTPLKSAISVWTAASSNH